MNLPQDNETVYEATLVEPVPQKSGPSIGCIIGIVFGCLFFLAIVGLAVVVSQLRPEVFSPPNPIAVEDDFAEVKEFLATEGVPEALRVKHVTMHPAFEEIDQFVESMAAELDDTANKKIQKRIDHRRYWKETSKRSTIYFYESGLTRSELQELIDSTSGPPPFTTGEYEIVRIDEVASGGYRVALSYDYGYDSETLFVWWLSETRGRLQIYDWFNAEFGIRESFEYAALCDASLGETAADDRHADAETGYFDIDEDLGHGEYQRELRKYLKLTETYRGPSSLRGKNELIAAKRWAYHGEPLEAMRVIDTISSPNSTPGVYLLRAGLQFQNGFYGDAVSSYQSHVQAAGTSPFAERQLIQCARAMGETAKEKRLLAAYCEYVTQGKTAEVLSLIELNSDAENEILFERIDSSADKAEIYESIVGQLKYRTFYRHQFEALVAHLKRTNPNSTTLRLAELNAASDTESFVNAISWLDGLGPETADEQRYDFWYAVPDEKMLDVFKAVDNKEAHFAEIADYYRYEDYFPEGMQKICELTLEENPESQTANGTLARLLIDDGKFEAAIARLNEALKGAEDDDESHPYNYSMLRALYESGKSKKAIAWAASHDLVDSLINLKESADDFSEFETLLAKLDQESDNYRYHLAVLKASRGETDAAADDLIAMINEAESDESREVDYRLRWRLKQIFKKAGHPVKIVEAFPTEESFWEVANQLILQRDWQGCERLTKLAEPSLEDSQRTLALMVDSQQGKYEMLATMRKGLDVFPKSPSNLDRIRDDFISASIREGDFENAELWANSNESSSARNSALAGVFIKKGDWKQAAERLRQMTKRERAYLPTDRDAWDDAAYEQPEIAAMMPTRSTYSIDRNADLSFELLFESAPSLDAAKLKRQFATTLGDDIETEIHEASWMTFSNGDLTIVVEQSSPRYKAPPKSYRVDEDEKPLQELFLKTRSRLQVTVYSSLPLSGVDSVRIFDALAKPFCDLKPQLLGSSSMFLTPDKFDSWFAAKSKNESTLAAGDDCRGQYAYRFRDTPTVDAKARESFALEVASALRGFSESSDAEKTFSVRIRETVARERFVIDVDRIERNQYRDMSLIGTARYAEDVPRVGLLPGEVSFTISEVQSFDANFDQTKIERNVK